MYIFCVRWMKTSSKIGLVLVAFEIILVRNVWAIIQWQQQICI